MPDVAPGQVTTADAETQSFDTSNPDEWTEERRKAHGERMKAVARERKPGSKRRGRPPGSKTAKKTVPPRAPTTPPPPFEKVKLAADLEGRIASWGGMLLVAGQVRGDARLVYDGQTIMANSAQLATALADVAEDDPKMRRALMALSKSSPYGALGMALAAMLVPIAANHGLLPRQTVDLPFVKAPPPPAREPAPPPADNNGAPGPMRVTADDGPESTIDLEALERLAALAGVYICPACGPDPRGAEAHNAAEHPADVGPEPT